MSSEPRKPSPVQALIEQLRHPLKLRVFLSLTILAGWYFLFYGPLAEQIDATRRIIDKERKRLAVAHKIDDLRKGMAASREPSPSKADLNDLIQHVMNRIGSSSLKLVDLTPDRTKAAGPYDSLSLHLTCEGSYDDLQSFLKWVLADGRLLRVDELNLTPARKGPGAQQGPSGRLVAQILLNSLMERTAQANP